MRRNYVRKQIVPICRHNPSSGAGCVALDEEIRWRASRLQSDGGGTPGGAWSGKLKNRDPVTRRIQLRAWAVACARAVTVGSIVKHEGSRTTTPLRRLIGLAVVSWMLVVVSGWAATCLDPPAPHGPHAVVSALGPQFAEVVDHPHCLDGSIIDLHHGIAAAVLPRDTTLPLALGLVTAVVLALGWWGAAVGTSMRGPPQAARAVLWGRDRLTRFCITRC